MEIHYKIRIQRFSLLFYYYIEKEVCGDDSENGFEKCRGRACDFGRADPCVSRISVSTGAVNEPAMRLYCAHGFQSVGEREVAPGVVLALFEREIGRPYKQ
jgi:hypothetical protein